MICIHNTPKSYIMQDSMFKEFSNQISVRIYGVGGVVGVNPEIVDTEMTTRLKKYYYFPYQYITFLAFQIWFRRGSSTLPWIPL